MNDFFKAVQKFIMDYLPKQKCCSENTIRSYKMTLNLFVDFLRQKKNFKVKEIDFKFINREIITEFLEWLETERKCSVSSRNQRLAALRSFFNYAGLIDCVNVSTSLAISKIPRKNQPSKVVDFLSENALKLLLEQPNLTDNLGLRNGFFMILMYDTAARCSELLNLRLCDVNAEDKTPTVYLTGKGNKTRLVPLMRKTLDHYKNYLKAFHKNASLKSTDYLFYTIIHNHKNKMSPDTVALFMSKYGKLSKEKHPEMPSHIHPHMLRHTRAIHLYRNGMPLELVSQFLGHSQLETSRIYAFADTEMKRDAILKADKLLAPNAHKSKAMWKDDEDMILRLSGLR
jgi:site-specific recombinase XerD